MKTALIATCICLLYIPALAQKLTTDTLPGTTSLYDTYIKKSQRKSKAAGTLKYVAIGSAVTSGVFFLIAFNKNNKHSNQMFSGLEEGIVGFGFGAVAVGSGLTAVFLSASSKKYRRAALTLSPNVKIETLPVPDSKGRRQLTGSVALLF